MLVVECENVFVVCLAAFERLGLGNPLAHVLNHTRARPNVPAGEAARTMNERASEGGEFCFHGCFHFHFNGGLNPNF